MKYLGYDLAELVEKEKYIRKLSKKQRRFVETFCIFHSIEKVAKAIGLKPYVCLNYLKNEKIQKAIEYMEEIISFRNCITQDYFVNKLKDIIEDKHTRVKEKIDALALLARITGHIKEKQETTATMVVVKQEGLKSEDNTVKIVNPPDYNYDFSTNNS